MSEDARLNTAAAAAPQADLTGIGVVAGVAARPAMWVRPRPALPTDGPEIPESDRESQKERFDIAAATVAGRLDAWTPARSVRRATRPRSSAPPPRSSRTRAGAAPSAS